MSMARLNTLFTRTSPTIQNLYTVKCEWQRERAIGKRRLQLHTQASSISSTVAASSSIGLTIPDAICTVLCS
jgi:hypothetical protein